jgi:replicative DNA helicase
MIEEIEKAVLGAIVIDAEALEDVINLLSVDIFEDNKAKTIIQIILDLYKKGDKHDILTISEEIKNRNLFHVVTVMDVASLTNGINGSWQLETHIRILHQRWIRKEIRKSGNELLIQADDYEIDSLDLLGKAETTLNTINNLIVKGEVQSTQSIAKNVLAKNEKIIQNDKGLSGIPSGFGYLDKVTGGWQDSDLIILAARPGMGKTSLALNLWARPSINHNIPTAFFSLEMSAEQLFQRVISQESGIPLSKIAREGIRGEDLKAFEGWVDHLASQPLSIDDTGGISISDFHSKASKLKREKNIRLIVIDYLQLMTSGVKSHSQNHEVGLISGKLKMIAKELNIPIIVLSQLSRAVEQRGGAKKPVLSDLRDSGSIEQDADMVMFLYRPEYYGITSDETGESTEGLAELEIAKHRNGSLSTIELEFIPSRTTFENRKF